MSNPEAVHYVLPEGISMESLSDDERQKYIVEPSDAHLSQVYEERHYYYTCDCGGGRTTQIMCTDYIDSTGAVVRSICESSCAYACRGA